MSDHRESWTEADYPSMSWHDNHVHGIEIRSGEHGTGELLLDLDYILEWLPPIEGTYRFLIAPATLHFREVTELQLSLDYLSPQAALTPFSISEVRRDEHVYSNGYTTFRWSIVVNWPEGKIAFIATGYNQTLRASPIITTEQCLTRDQRQRYPKDASSA